MKDLMLDLETLGTGNNAVITQIGACYFDPMTGVIDEKTLSVNIDFKESIKRGFEVDAETIKFWFELPDKSRTFLKDPVSIECAMSLFRAFSYRCERVWSDAIFDFVLLTNLYTRMGKKPPINFRQCRDIRTLMTLAEIEREKIEREDAHDALSDCIYQVGYCSKSFQKIRFQK